MPYDDEFCILHGNTMIFDRKSGLDICYECDRLERLANDIRDGETICGHGKRPFECKSCYPNVLP